MKNFDQMRVFEAACIGNLVSVTLQSYSKFQVDSLMLAIFILMLRIKIIVIYLFILFFLIYQATRLDCLICGILRLYLLPVPDWTAYYVGFYFTHYDNRYLFKEFQSNLFNRFGIISGYLEINKSMTLLFIYNTLCT